MERGFPGRDSELRLRGKTTKIILPWRQEIKYTIYGLKPLKIALKSNVFPLAQ